MIKTEVHRFSRILSILRIAVILASIVSDLEPCLTKGANVLPIAPDYGMSKASH